VADGCSFFLLPPSSFCWAGRVLSERLACPILPVPCCAILPSACGQLTWPSR